MTFQEIFKKPGLYKTNSFQKGVAFEISEDLTLYLVIYKDKDDLFPEKQPQIMYAGLFDKEYEKVFTRQSLFK